MAVIAKTDVTERLPAGNLILQTYVLAGATGIAKDDEWIVTGLSEVIAVVGFADISLNGPGQANTPRFSKNQLGSNGAASNGALGIETVAAVLSGDLEVTVLGRP